MFICVCNLSQARCKRISAACGDGNELGEEGGQASAL